MNKLSLFLFLMLPTVASCQRAGKLDIKASYISLYLKDKTGKCAWQPMHDMPAGNFACQEQKNGDLMITYNRNSPPSKFINATKEYAEKTKKYPKEICGFSFKGIYYDPEQPSDFYHALYYDKNRPNTLLMFGYIEDGRRMFGVNFYSDQKDNPLEATNLQYDLL